MLTIRFPGSSPSSPLAYVQSLDQLIFETTISNPTSTGFTAADGLTQFSITGIGITYVTVPFVGTLPNGGTITSFTVVRSGQTVLEVSGSFSMAAAYNAAVSEITGADFGALERLFGQTDYDYRGKGNADIFRPGTRSGDNLLLDPAGDDLFVLAGGNDAVTGGSGNDTVRGGAGLDTVWGDAGDDRLTGDAGADLLFGGAGRDSLFGGGQNDELQGGQDADVLTGDAGADSFVMFRPAGLVAERDTVTDFERGVDAVRVYGDAQFTGARFRGDAGDIRFTLQSGDGLVQIDYDGDRRADATMVLKGVTRFDADDLLL